MTKRQLWAALGVLIVIVVGLLVFAFDDPSDDDGAHDFGDERSSSIAPPPS